MFTSLSSPSAPPPDPSYIPSGGINYPKPAPATTGPADLPPFIPQPDARPGNYYPTPVNNQLPSQRIPEPALPTDVPPRSHSPYLAPSGPGLNGSALVTEEPPQCNDVYQRQRQNSAYSHPSYAGPAVPSASHYGHAEPAAPPPYHPSPQPPSPVSSWRGMDQQLPGYAPPSFSERATGQPLQDQQWEGQNRQVCVWICSCC